MLFFESTKELAGLIYFLENLLRENALTDDLRNAAIGLKVKAELHLEELLADIEL